MYYNPMDVLKTIMTMLSCFPETGSAVNFHRVPNFRCAYGTRRTKELHHTRSRMLSTPESD